MNEEELVLPQPQPPQSTAPVCPYCGDDPMRVTGSPFKMGGNVLMSLYCGNIACRRMITIAVIGAMEPPRVVLVPRGGGMKN